MAVAPRVRWIEAMMNYRPDAVSEISSDAFIRLYEMLSGYDFSTAKKHTRKDYAVVCPMHHDEHASMSFDPAGRQWFCPVCHVGGGIADMVLEFKPNDFSPTGFNEKQRRASAFRWLRKKGFVSADAAEEDYERRHGLHILAAPLSLTRTALKAIPNAKATNKSGYPVLANKKTTIFAYTDALGTVENEVMRFDGQNSLGEDDKYIVQRTVLPSGGAWVETATSWMYALDGRGIATVPLTDGRGKRRRKPAGPYVYGIDRDQPRRLYHLPDVLAAAARGELIVVVEGERKCDELRKRTGLCVTTWAEGAKAELQSEWLRNVAGASRLWVLADSDPYKERSDGVVRSEGREAALDRAHFFRHVIFDVRAIDLFPDREDKSDVYDWLHERPGVSPAELIAELEELAAATEAVP
jgi:hypothetical protein